MRREIALQKCMEPDFELQPADKYLEEILELMLMVNRYGKFNIEKIMEREEKAFNDHPDNKDKDFYVDRKRYEADLNYFKEWFQQNDQLLR